MNGLNIIDAQKCTDKKNLNVIIDNEYCRRSIIIEGGSWLI